MGMTQAEQYEPFWRAHRDSWKPVTPADVWGLREDRTFQPPSKGHLKRLARMRPIVTPAEKRQRDADGARAAVNQRAAAGKRVLAACGCLPVQYVARPADKQFIDPVPPPPATPERRAAQRHAEAVRCASYGMIGRGTLVNLHDALRAYRSI